VWKAGETAKGPIKLECAHVFGIQCFARLVFTSDFSNHCPLCRATVVPDSYEQNPSDRARGVATPLLKLLTSLDRQLATLVKTESLGLLQRTQERWTPVERKQMDRTMILYEELLNQFCDHPPAESDGDHALAAELQVQELRRLILCGQELNTQLEQMNAQVARDRERRIRAEADAEVLDAKKELEVAKKQLNEAKKKQEVAKKQLNKANKKKKGALLLMALFAIPFHIWGKFCRDSEALLPSYSNICISLRGAMIVVATS